MPVQNIRKIRSLICLLFAATALIVAGTASAKPNPAQNLFRGLIDQDAKSLTDGRFNNRYILVNFVFTGCGATCPLQTAELAKFDKSLAGSLRSKVQLLSISVDPINDTPKYLKSFANRYKADGSRWSFATGKPDDVFAVVKNFAALRPGEKNDPNLHTTEVYLFDVNGRMIQRYNGTPLAAEQLKTDLEALIQMAS